MRKSIICILLLFSMLASLVSCAKAKYEPVESTEEEARVIMTLEMDSKKYEVKYELYRALFLTYRSEIDGGDSSVWTGENKNEYIEKINDKILDRITDIYSVFALCDRIEFDVYSSSVDKQVEEYIRISIEGDGGIEGVGSYEKYLEELKKMHMNYSVQDLMLRYSIATDAINKHYIGIVDSDEIDSDEVTVGALEYTIDDVREFYNSDNCVRVLRTYLQANVSYNPEERAERVRQAIEDASANGEKAVAYAMIANGSLIAESEVEKGYVIGRHNLDPAYYGEMTNIAFDLDVGEVSPVIEVQDGSERVFYVLYRAEKSDENFEENYSHILYVYLTDTVGGLVDNAKDELAKSANWTDVMNTLEYSQIGM